MARRRGVNHHGPGHRKGGRRATTAKQREAAIRNLARARAMHRSGHLTPAQYEADIANLRKARAARHGVHRSTSVHAPKRRRGKTYRHPTAGHHPRRPAHPRTTSHPKAHRTVLHHHLGKQRTTHPAVLRKKTHPGATHPATLRAHRQHPAAGMALARSVVRREHKTRSVVRRTRRARSVVKRIRRVTLH